MDFMKKVLCDSLFILLVIFPQLFRMVSCYEGVFRFYPYSIWRGTVTNHHFKGDPALCADRNWNFNSAQIVCRTLGFTGAMFYDNPANQESGSAVECQFNSVTDIPCQIKDDCQELAWVACQLPGYEGCYSGEAFSGYARFPISGSLTIEKCLEGCRNLNGVAHRYAALSTGTKCYCSDEKPRSTLSRAASNCDTPCQGDTGQACGGSPQTHSSVYNTILGSCEGMATSNSGYITSPGFPGEITSGQSCSWHYETDYFNRTLISVVGADLGGSSQFGIAFEAATIHKTTFDTGEASFTIGSGDSDISIGDEIWRTDEPIEKLAEGNTYRKNMTVRYSSSSSNVRWFVLKFEVDEVDFELPTTTDPPRTTPSKATKLPVLTSLSIPSSSVVQIGIVAFVTQELEPPWSNNE